MNTFNFLHIRTYKQTVGHHPCLLVSWKNRFQLYGFVDFHIIGMGPLFKEILCCEVSLLWPLKYLNWPFVWMLSGGWSEEMLQRLLFGKLKWALKRSVKTQSWINFGHFTQGCMSRSCKRSKTFFQISLLLFLTWREYFYSQPTHFSSQPKKERI